MRRHSTPSALVSATRAAVIAFVALSACSEEQSPPSPGVLVVSHSITAEPLTEPTWLRIQVDTLEPGDLVQPGQLHVIGDLSPGQHSVILDYPVQCSTASDTLTAVVPPADTAHVAFALSCRNVWGTVWLEMPTTGTNLPGLLYFSSDDSPDKNGFAPNTVGGGFGVTEGTRSISVVDLAANCVVTDPNPQTIVVTPGSSTTLRFAVHCN